MRNLSVGLVVLLVAATVSGQVTGVRPGTGASNAGKAEDAAHASGDVGYEMLCVRSDTAAVTGGTDGDYSACIVDASGRLYVNATAGTVTPAAGAPAASYVEDAAETAGAALSMAGATVRAGKTGSTATAADNATLNVTTEGGLWGASDQIEDAAETAATPLAMAGTVRRDTAASSAGTTGDNATLNTDDTGLLWTRVGAAVAPTGMSTVTCAQVDVPSSGTAVQLASTSCKTVTVSCESGNTSSCWVTHAAGNGVTSGMEIAKGERHEFRITNTNLLFVDAGTNGDDVGWCCTN